MAWLQALYAWRRLECATCDTIGVHMGFVVSHLSGEGYYCERAGVEESAAASIYHDTEWTSDGYPESRYPRVYALDCIALLRN